MNDATIRRIAEAYGRSVAEVLPPQKGYRNQSFALRLANGAMANIIIYKREPGIVATIRRANVVGDCAAAAGLPARATLDSRVMTMHNPQGLTRYAALYNYLPGHTIPWEAYTMDHLKLAGMGMARLHGVLAGRAFDTTLPRVTDIYADILRRMQRYFAEPGVQRALGAKLGIRISLTRLAGYNPLLAWCQRLPNQQALHMDFVRGNMLFAETPQSDLSSPLEQSRTLALPNSPTHLTGILDFEKTAWGHPLFDIARTLAFLLVDCQYKSEAQIRKYFVQSGYVRHGGGAYGRILVGDGRHQYDLLEILIDIFLLHDFYKFLRHNLYESLPQNHHFTRTLALLRRRQVLQ